MAIVTQSGALVVDAIVPILLHDKKLCEKVVNGVLVQSELFDQPAYYQFFTERLFPF